MSRIEVFAPAKINLTLHVTGQRADGYHLLDSYVMFADVGDRVFIEAADEMALSVTGPRAAGVPDDARNLCWKAADFYGAKAAITLEKHLPAAAGIGGGSSDAAAVLQGLEQVYGRAVPFDTLALGADVPVCMVRHAAHMTGVGDYVMPLFVEFPMPCVLVNPGVEVSTPEVFKRLASKNNPPMEPWPEGGGNAAAYAWLDRQRNDLQDPAIEVQPVIAEVLTELKALPGARLVRMSGSGATCFALFDTFEEAEAGALALAAVRRDWWMKACQLR